MATTKWGILGAGDIARTFIKDLKYVSGEHEIAAILGHHKESTKEFAEEFGVPVYTTELSDFIERAEIDIAYIATPHPQHFEEALACLENNIHVLCEKPITLNTTQCKKLAEASKRNQVFLMEAMWLRFLPSILQAKKLVDEGQIGKLISVHASMSYLAPKDSKNRYYNPELGGGSLLDLGIYPVFLAHLFLGFPADIKAIGRLSEQEIDEVCSILLKYDSGAYAMLESSLLSQIQSPAVITGELGLIKILNPWFEKSGGVELQRHKEGSIVYPSEWKGHGLHFEISETLNCIRENKIESPLLSHDFSINTLRILDEIRQQIHVTYAMYE